MKKKETYPSNQPRMLFETRLPRIAALASESRNEDEFKRRLCDDLHTEELHPASVRNIRRLIEYDGKTIYELSTEREIRIETISLFWRLLKGYPLEAEVSEDLWTDLFRQFLRLRAERRPLPNQTRIDRWMKRWPDGRNETVQAIRRDNKERMLALLTRKIENRSAGASQYVFPAGADDAAKRRLTEKWWFEPQFQLAMAVKSPSELNRMLGNTLTEETLHLYRKAREKGMPIFITPYYLSLLDPTGKGYDDAAIRSYILYSPQLVEAYGSIRAWEREDRVESGKPNAAGWLLPQGRNIHRRYPETAILIPDSMGRACGGLCASCQRMYDFQSHRLNFDFAALRPRESWNSRQRKLMDYFEHDTQLRDILITGGDALMSRNSTLRNLLDAIYRMAVRKKRANRSRPAGEKYAELQRVRLGTRLPVYLPMRIDDELIGILRDFREKASAVGVRQFIIQTHFQSPLEATPEAQEAVRKILSTGWSITNQLVFNVAASRRGHTAELRRVLNRMGILCYYTFTVKGFDENHAVYAPIGRLLQERFEEKVAGRLAPASEKEFTDLFRRTSDRATTIRRFCTQHRLPFVATDRSVLNLPAIGKSMTFEMVGIAPDGRRILEFDHDRTRRHSPIIDRMGKIYIRENKSIGEYLRQLAEAGENPSDYDTVWDYTEGMTESRFPLFDYPDEDSGLTPVYSNLLLEEEG